MQRYFDLWPHTLLFSWMMRSSSSSPIVETRRSSVLTCPSALETEMATTELAGDDHQSYPSPSPLSLLTKRARKNLPQDEGNLRKHTVTPSSSDLTSTADSSATTRCLSRDETRNLLWTEAAYDAQSSSVVTKRTDYITWDDYFMAVAALSAQRSKDPARPSGACLVDSEQRIVGVGYTGFPMGCSDDCLPWSPPPERNEPGGASQDAPICWLHTPDPYTVHAEVNAILNKCSSDSTGARLYAQHFPCHECAKVIIQSGIREVVYLHDADQHLADHDNKLKASRILLTMAGIRMRPYRPVKDQIQLDFGQALSSVPDPVSARVDDNAFAKEEEAMKHRDLLIQLANYDPLVMGSTKRCGVLSWDDYFMAMAFLTAQRSKDPNTQVGACLVDPQRKRILGLGYNGFPRGCSDDDLPWARHAAHELHKKYMYVCHAEVNAILNKGSANVNGATLYVALFPCHDCAKIIIQAGIREVVYMSDQYHDTDSCRASRILFQMSGVSLRRYVPSGASMCIHLDSKNESVHGNHDEESKANS